jgi:hypothetical protein
VGADIKTVRRWPQSETEQQNEMLVVELIPSGDAPAVITVEKIDQVVTTVGQGCPSAQGIGKSGQLRAGVHNVVSVARGCRFVRGLPEAWHHRFLGSIVSRRWRTEGPHPLDERRRSRRVAVAR